MQIKLSDILLESKVDTYYDKIIQLTQNAARKLSDDEADELHEKLKAFFTKTI
jgi:hypothetical protein